MREWAMAALALAILAAGTAPGGAQAAADDFSTWNPLVPNFPSTGGGGVMIGEYRPVVRGDTCTTDFTATEPTGTVYRNTVVFNAVPMSGGILCTNGRWRSLDNDASGTTPFRVFFRDGVPYASP